MISKFYEWLNVEKVNDDHLTLALTNNTCTIFVGYLSARPVLKCDLFLSRVYKKFVQAH